MTRSVNFGLWYDFRNPGHQVSFEKLYRDSLEQIAWAETIGFDSVWLTEHHFVQDGYCPSPLVVAAAIGERTTRMRIGTNLMLLPLADPVRLAEDAAALAILTGGRFDLGVGLGYRQLEFDYFGRKISHRPSLMEEGVSVIRQAWSGESISHQGKRYNIEGIKVSPVPETIPKLLMGGMAEPAIDRAARLGDGFLSTGGIGLEEYTSAAKRAGRDAAIYAGHWGIIADDPEKEAVEVGGNVLYQTNEYISWGAFGPPAETPLFENSESAIAGGLYELLDGAGAVEALTSLLQGHPGIKDIHFWAQFPGESVEHGSRRIEYIANHVLPAVRKNIA
ncbi:MAG: LLM class flavin-dependent oxidoreductase [Gammaproteobacteria bacterium]|jgi:alkanesulfonate monooxygenase SsuD/methylene tetrahydromethanopterin reductase-like flavin-dependent oxidoreductase (luciferase family)|nr:LLM class flavin-dependent oxidoreductase [Gammaproteobacteria bacterium]MBT5725304.1 LLM class flavin-dependent oxidoreductase [Gammaproteobacteria bacterium]MBT6586478.1 LLM class flavin-dependent oxidoreductase [Gammaproteobacteria bacterium]MBT6890883.1 LLM class flavin-dependent oxidoreductase [Gammaproteobacteria bacterium]MBT7877747.1 LLM class flavin-dependent oxidoreductase [Gammaproteobacteria bacterium]